MTCLEQIKADRAERKLYNIPVDRPSRHCARKLKAARAKLDKLRERITTMRKDS
jgi:hypothetical protein